MVRKILVGPLPVPSQVGDAAIAAGAVALLRGAFPSAELSGWSAYVGTGDRRVIKGFLDTYGVDEVIYSPVTPSEVHGKATEIRGALAKYALPSMARVMGAHAVRMPLGPVSEIAAAIADADLVIMRGGGYLSSPHILCDLCGLRLNSLSEIAVARSLGIPYAIWGHTIWELNGPLSKPMLWPLIRDSAVTVCREQRSYDYLVAAGAPEDRLAVLPDTAFAVGPATGARVQELLANEGLDSVSKPLIGANVSPIWTNNRSGDLTIDEYVEAFIGGLKRIASKWGVHPVLVMHGFNTELDAVPECQDDALLAQRVSDALGADCTIIAGSYTPSELAGLYGAFEGMITTRLHAGILAAVGGTPAVMISYEANKTLGIADMLGTRDLVMDLAEISPASLASNADRLLGSVDEWTATLERNFSSLRGELGRYVEYTRRALGTTQ